MNGGGYARQLVWAGRHYDPNNSHVLPALIRRMHEANSRRESSGTVG